MMRSVRTMWPFRQVGLKLLSVGLAVVLWMVVSGEEAAERGLRVPLELQLPSGLELLGEPPSTVNVRVRGASGTLGRVSPGEIVAVLDLRGARVGRRLIHLTSEQVRAPFGLEVVQVTPATVAMVFERSATRQVPVVPAVDGRPAPGFVVGAVTAEPQTVEIAGPESSVERATEALTEPVSIAGARDHVRESVNVGLADPALRLTSPRAATVVVHVLPAPVERTVHDVPVHLRNLAANLLAQAIPSTLDVSLRGERGSLSLVEADDIAAYVDLAGLGSGQYTLTVHAETSREAGVTDIDPETVRVRILSGKN